MDKQEYIKVLRCMLALLVGFVMLSLMSSCEDDNPEPKIDYYFTIASKPPDYYPVTKGDMAYVITRIMRDSIKAVYPKPTLEGNDFEVISVCDRVYQKFREDHPDAYKYFYCVATLHRARMNDMIIRTDSKIRYYDF